MATATKDKAAETKVARITIEDAGSGPLTVEAKCKNPKELRETSKRGELLKALRTKNGITMAKACNQFEWKPRDFADALRLLAKVNGVVTKREENGHWHLVSEPALVGAE